MLIHNFLDKLSNIQDNEPCLIHGNLQLTRKDLLQQVDTLASQLASHVKKGTKVLLKLPCPITQLIYFLGIIKVGGACILIDSSTSQEVCTKLVVAHTIDLYIDENFKLLPPTPFALPEIHWEDIFMGALSSGSTGNPKVIWRDHQSWTRAFPVQSTVFNLSGKDTLYLVGSLVYTANLNACLHILSEGGTVVIASNSLPRTWLEEITTHPISALFLVPTHYALLLKAMKNPCLQIKSVLTAGAKINIATVKGLMKFFPQAAINAYYGASELGHVSYATGNDLLLYRESVGKAFPGVTISIEDDCIYVKSPYLAPSYRPKATANDLGHLDANGYLYLLGRKQGLINTSGIKVIPEELEALLLECPGIQDVVVGGIPDPIRGQKVCAWIVKNKSTLTTTAILDYCRTKIRSHYCPQVIIFIDKLPLMGNGKIDKRKLLQQEVYCD